MSQLLRSNFVLTALLAISAGHLCHGTTFTYNTTVALDPSNLGTYSGATSYEQTINGAPAFTARSARRIPLPLRRHTAGKINVLSVTAANSSTQIPASFSPGRVDIVANQIAVGSAAPEPASFALCGIGCVVLGLLRRSK